MHIDIHREDDRGNIIRLPKPVKIRFRCKSFVVTSGSLSYKALQDVQTAKEIIAHEFSHSQLKTIDGLAGKGIYSEEFYERIRDAWVWAFLF